MMKAISILVCEVNVMDDEQKRFLDETVEDELVTVGKIPPLPAFKGFFTYEEKFIEM